MTAEEWLACQDPEAMLNNALDRVWDPRRLTLFACACARRVWPLLAGACVREAIVTVEAWAEGLANIADLEEARRELSAICERERVFAQLPFGGLPHTELARRCALAAAWAAVGLGEDPAAGQVWVQHAAWRFAKNAVWQAEGAAAAKQEEAWQVALLRCIFPNPFRPPATMPPAALRHNDGAVVKLATIIYDERDPETGLLDPVGLAMLADALEEAGVDDAAALKYLRGPDSPHFRGCFVVDVVLGRA